MDVLEDIGRRIRLVKIMLAVFGGHGVGEGIREDTGAEGGNCGGVGGDGRADAEGSCALLGGGDSHCEK